MAGTAVAAGCGGTYGGPAPISDFPQKSLTVSHFSGGPRSGLTATLNFDDLSWCDVLESDAFARLDGRPVPLFPGQVKVIPPQGDDGSVECLHPSVTLADFPSDLPPPWTIEIGDSSETLSATFAAAPFAPVTLSDPVLTSAALTLKLQRQPGDETAITGQATLTASDGQSTTRVAQAGDAEIAFSTFTALWPAGPVAVAVTLDFFSPDELLDCQAPKCTVTQGSGVQGPPATATFTVQLVTPTDYQEWVCRNRLTLHLGLRRDYGFVLARFGESTTGRSGVARQQRHRSGGIDGPIHMRPSLRTLNRSLSATAAFLLLLAGGVGCGSSNSQTTGDGVPHDATSGDWDGGGAGGSTATSEPPLVNLRTALGYVILAESDVSTVPPSVITGDLGLSPMAASFITGFSLIADSTNAFSTSTQVTGKVYAADYAVPTPSQLTTAIGDMGQAFTDAAGRAPDVTELGAGNIGGMTLASGVYRWGTGLLIPSDLTLNGGATSVWIFQIAQSLTLSSGVKVHLTGGALAKNVFWQVSGSVDLGTTSHLEGIVLCKTMINLRTGASVAGRLLAQTAVTVDTSTIVQPAP